MLDRDLAGLYQVETRRLNEQIRRNLDRFPEDFMFQLSKEEIDIFSRSHFAILKQGQNIKYAPYAFTEHGVIMLSSVLRSSVATQVNLQIVRAFVSLRQMIAVKPEYELLRETVRRIEADVKIDGKIMSGKLSQLSQKVNALSGLFEQFQESYVVIKRPVEGVGDG